MIATLQGKYTKNPPYHCDMEDYFVIYLESNLANPLVYDAKLNFFSCFGE